MHSLAPFVLLILFVASGRLTAQEVDSAFRRNVPTVGVFAGLGSGPIEAAAWGVEASVPLSRYFSIRAEYSGWGNGVGGTMCVAMPPDSHRCSVSGWAGLAGIAATVPVQGPLGIFAGMSGGRFTRDWLGDATVSSTALALDTGARVRLYGSLSARVGARFLRAFDDDYQTLLGENLQYRMGIFGLEYGIGR